MSERLVNLDNVCICVTRHDYSEEINDPIRQSIEETFGRILKKFYVIDGETIVTICEKKDS